MEGVEIEHRYESVFAGFSARLSPQALEELRANPNVAYIEEDRIVTLPPIIIEGGGDVIGNPNLINQENPEMEEVTIKTHLRRPPGGSPRSMAEWAGQVEPPGYWTPVLISITRI